MRNVYRRLLLASVAILGAGAATPSWSIVTTVTTPNPSDFGFQETATLNGGTYKITNNSTSWWIYAFQVTNPLAGQGAATTTQTDWTGCGVGSCLGNSFHYSNIFGSDSSYLAYDIAPGQSSSLFFFNVATASTPTFDVTNADGVTESFTPTGSAAPEPATWAILATGFALLGWKGWRRRTAKLQLAASPLSRTPGA